MEDGIVVGLKPVPHLDLRLAGHRQTVWADQTKVTMRRVDTRALRLRVFPVL